MAKVTLKGARVSAGLSQEECAKRIGVSRSVVSDWEVGNTEIKLYYLYALCYVTGFSANDILLPEKYAKRVHSEE